MKSNTNIPKNMSGSKKRMSMSNLLLNEDNMNYNSSQNNTFRMKNYQTHKAQNYSTGQNSMNNRQFNRSQRDLKMFNQSRLMKSPSGRKMMKNDSSLYLNRDKSHTKKSPLRSKKSNSTIYNLNHSRSISFAESAPEEGIGSERTQL